MAEQESEYFTPEIVDEQIDASLAGPHLAYYRDPSLQVVGALQRHYAATGDHQPLERVWNRLAQHRFRRTRAHRRVHSWQCRLAADGRLIG